MEHGGRAPHLDDREAHGVVQGRRGLTSIGPSPYDAGTSTTSPTPTVTSQDPSAHGPAGEGAGELDADTVGSPPPADRSRRPPSPRTRVWSRT